jgi:4-diphosphocytidyl-2-C-methyl-D-erythritol kinase
MVAGLEQRSAPYSIKAPAKLNLRLKVTGLRPDGYHDIVSVMAPVDLLDHLELCTNPTGDIRIEASGYPVPTDNRNLVFRAAESFLARAGLTEGISVKLTKNIPVAAGLGGGSSDAAATLLCLNEINNRPLSDRALHNVAVRLGADVPFFLICRPSLARGIGEILEPIRAWPDVYYVIVTPPLEVSTSWVYRNLKLKLTTGEYQYINKFFRNDSFSISHILENDLEKVTSASFPIIDTIKKHLLEAGAEGALMSGSGPSVYGVFSSLDSAGSAKERLLSQDLGDVFIATHWER